MKELIRPTRIKVIAAFAFILFCCIGSYIMDEKAWERSFEYSKYTWQERKDFNTIERVLFYLCTLGWAFLLIIQSWKIFISTAAKVLMFAIVLTGFFYWLYVSITLFLISGDTPINFG